MVNVYEAVARVTGTLPPNVDVGTGIHFGTIYANDGVSPDAVNEIVFGGVDLYYESARQEAVEKAKDAVRDALELSDLADEFNDTVFQRVLQRTLEAVEEAVDENFGDTWDSGGGGRYRLETEDSIIEFSADDNSLTVLKSPYYTEAANCSPCFPNGGYIGKPGPVRTYALGHDWYDEGKAPTELLLVATNEKVLAQPVLDVVL